MSNERLKEKLFKIRRTILDFPYGSIEVGTTYNEQEREVIDFLYSTCSKLSISINKRNELEINSDGSYTIDPFDEMATLAIFGRILGIIDGKIDEKVKGKFQTSITEKICFELDMRENIKDYYYQSEDIVHNNISFIDSAMINSFAYKFFPRDYSVLSQEELEFMKYYIIGYQESESINLENLNVVCEKLFDYLIHLFKSKDYKSKYKTRM